MTIFHLLALGHINVPGFKINGSACSMCGICLQLGFRQNLPQAQIPVERKNRCKGYSRYVW